MRPIWLILVAMLCTAAVDRDDDPRPTPLMRVVEPSSAKPGSEVIVTGDYLGERYVAEVYLTASDTNIPVQLLKQTDKEIRFTVPAHTKPGRYSLTVLLRSVDPVLIEEPVQLTVQ
jgi:IPT/TIG domain